MSSKAKREYLLEVYKRYRTSIKEEKKKILDEFCSVCGYHRKYALKLLNKDSIEEISRPKRRAGRKKKYHKKAVIDFIQTLWIKTNLICSKRLKAAIPFWLPWYRKEIVNLSPADEKLIREISPATIDRNSLLMDQYS